MRESGFAAHRDTLDAAAAAQFSERTGLYAGSGGGNYQNQYDYFPLIAETEGVLSAFGRELGSGVNPMWLLKSLPNNVLCHVGIRFGIKGPNACITNHSVGGMLAIVEAAAGLGNGEADRAVAVGHDTPIEPQNVLYYHGAGLLARDSLKPFDATRDGSLMGEGAGAVMVETESSARARGAAVLGRVLGAGHATESEGLLAIRDDGSGPARAIRAALADAGIDRRDVGMIVAHGNGTPASDASEAAAILEVFGAGAPPVTGFKWAIGHLIAAAGAIETVLAFEALRRGVVPGIPVLGRVDPAFAALPVSRESRKPASDVALVLSRGFGGTDAALVVARRLKPGMTMRRARRRTLRDRHGRDRARQALARGRRCRRDRAAVLAARARRCGRPGRDATAALAARFAAKEACLKLFPRETALETIAASDFSVERDAYGAPQVVPGPAAEIVMGRYRIGRIALSMSHDGTHANAVALAEHAPSEVPAIGRFVWRWMPFRRAVILENLRRVYGGRVDEAEIVRLAQMHYAHLARLVGEFLRFRWMYARAEGRDRARREPRGPRWPARDARARQGRADPHRPLRQLGGRDDRGRAQVSRGARPLPFRAPRDQAALARGDGDAAVPARRASA